MQTLQASSTPVVSKLSGSEPPAPPDTGGGTGGRIACALTYSCPALLPLSIAMERGPGGEVPRYISPLYAPPSICVLVPVSHCACAEAR
jgi:hypothetical protein